MVLSNSIAVCYQQDELKEKAEALAHQLEIPIVANCQDAADCNFLLVYSHHRSGYQLSLQFPTENLNPVVVDFNNDQLQYRKKFGGGRQQEIARAVGLKRGYAPNLFDGTAGLGRDAFILASLDCNVTMCERHPVIHALLADGLRRLQISTATNPGTPGHLALILGNSQDYLRNHSGNIDVVYLDPMYPHRNKSALVKKEMRILRNLVGDDMDFDSLLETALKTAMQRVVVKRPRIAPPIGTIPPSHSIESKKTRYDVYLTRLPK